MKFNQTHGKLCSGSNCGDQTRKANLPVISTTGRTKKGFPL